MNVSVFQSYTTSEWATAHMVTPKMTAKRMIARFIALLLCFSLPVYAAPHDEGIKNMVSQCRCVMEGGECKYQNGPPLKPGARVFTTQGPLPADVYNALKAEGGLMCQAGAEACTKDWNSDRCRVFRVWFRQDPVICVR